MARPSVSDPASATMAAPEVIRPDGQSPTGDGLCCQTEKGWVGPGQTAYFPTSSRKCNTGHFPARAGKMAGRRDFRARDGWSPFAGEPIGAVQAHRRPHSQAPPLP